MNRTTEIRQRLLANGYHPIPNKDRSTFLSAWNQKDYAHHPVLFGTKYKTQETAVASWIRRYPKWEATGLRIEGGLRAIDADIVHRELADIAYGIIADVAPDVADRAPMRYGASETKFALFVRSGGEGDVPDVTRLHSHKYLAKGEAEDARHSMIEIFTGKPTSTGNCSRQMGIYGPHSHHEDGSVAALYRWSPERPELADTKPDDLPRLSIEQATEILVRFEAAAEAGGWVRKKGSIVDIDTSRVAYDIAPETRFDTNRGGVQLNYEGLCEEHEIYGDALRCSSNFMPGRGLTPKPGWLERCSVLGGAKNRHGCVVVHVHGDEVTHFPVAFEPDHDQNILDEAVILPIAELLPDEPPEPAQDSDLHDKAAWLIDTRAYYEGGDTVVRIYADTLDCQTTPSAFSRRYRYMHVPNPDKRFKRPVFATDLWEMTPNRRNVAGVRMAPDRPFPLFEEGGQLWKNTYRRPRHQGAQNSATFCAPFVAFMERFTPDPVERSWLLDWMAHKWLHPEIPGTAVVFVADTGDDIREGEYGTGRGLLGKIARKLYGEQYVRSQSFAIVSGTSGQSDYNDWLHGSVLVTIDEAKTSPTAYRRGERNATYEILKELVDPAPKQHRFNGKNRQAFDGMSYASIWIATNHANAMAIPAHDRRFTVLRNGRPIEDDEITEILDWMDNPANIAALARWLETRDLAGFKMHKPLATAGKAEMAELSRSEVEDLLRDLMDDDSLGKVFARDHIKLMIEHNFNGKGNYWEGEFREAWPRYCVGLRHASGSPIRLKVFGTQKKLFCFRGQLKAVVRMPDAAIRREAAKWGGIDPVSGLDKIGGSTAKS
jgi:hypothetical protein